MTSLLASEASYAVIDVETTGLSPKKGDRVLEIAVVHIDQGEITSTWSTLVNPGNTIDPGPVEIHNITREMLDKAPTFNDIVGELITKLDGRILVAHNAQFDIGFIKNEFNLINLTVPTISSICTKEAARFLLHTMPSHRLGHLCENLNIKLDNWHTAEADTIADAKLHLYLLSLVPDLLVEQPTKGQWPDVENKEITFSR